jgi:hypothetical protein
MRLSPLMKQDKDLGAAKLVINFSPDEMSLVSLQG